jgi:uncharacterized membrane protein YhdT
MPNEMNVTTAVTSLVTGESGFSSWFSLVILVGLMVMIVLVFTIALSSVTRYKKARGIIAWLLSTVQYFFLGIGGLGALAVPSVILYYFINQAREGNTVPLWVTLSIISAYFIIASIGYFVKKYVLDRIVKYEEEYRKEHPEEYNDEENKKDESEKEANVSY